MKTIANPQRFEAFVLFRTVRADEAEIHFVGASGAPLDELVDDAIGLVRDLLRGSVDDEDEDLVESEIAKLGNHPDVATGIRVIGPKAQDVFDWLTDCWDAAGGAPSIVRK